ncbi:type VI secretion system ImpA family N-terminal domain-containing protein [uncultured Bartonella sp.]|uniref:type VI secretion system ImpA family N-terminal domain-containing protein n=1 Tax=uncultured Bartonella sp. TaxID=104108 RepID=UPI00262F0C90|nr:type VI secretion system ImpA family N-terminal domain-containing protein [uncultured Bartonella sp.]
MINQRAQNTLTGVEWIDRNPLFIAVGSSRQKPEQQGIDLIENELFDEVETEMMKRGTLNQSLIRWDWVCEQCIKLLSQESKDFRLLLYILQSLPNGKNYQAPLTLGAVLTSRFIGIWGDIAYPEEKNTFQLFVKFSTH